tara:strand:+ start:302 stop:565 length:264 start_codon:yes stop_codon:yes gene_type:complete
MKDKNFLDDIENKSLEELNSLANKIIDNLQKKGQEDFIQGYQQLLKLNNYIDKKFHQETRSISKKTKHKIDEIISNGKKTKKTIQKS